MLGSYVAFNLLPSNPFDLLASCIVSLTQRINKHVRMYVLPSYFKTSSGGPTVISNPGLPRENPVLSH